MELILSPNSKITLTPEQSQALRDEMKYACHTVSLFPVMERLLESMEA
jgi:hypothetical protein